MSVVELALKAVDDALAEAIKDRFLRIAGNEITMGPEEGEKQLRAAFQNLKVAHDQAIQIAHEVFGAENV